VQFQTPIRLGQKTGSKAAYTVTLTKANVARAEKRGSDLFDFRLASGAVARRNQPVV